MQGRFKRIATLLVVAILTLTAGVPLQVSARTPAHEASLKAGYLYNFMKLVTWPPHASQQLIVCVLGSNPFGTVIESLNGRLVGASTIRVVTEVPLEQTKYCHVVFVSRSESGRLMPILLRLRQLPILTVSDIEGFSAKGGIIELISSPSGDITFRVSQQSAEDVGLRVSSKLLSLSR